MSDLPMAQVDHPAYNVPDATQSYSGDQSDGYETARQVNAGPKTNKGGDGVDAYPGTDDNMFFAKSGRDESIIRAKRQLRDGMK